jgi:archaellum component FlaF (FlaF/FlaG flagellin family)
MNPVVLAAIAVSLVSLGTVSMASIASQQAVSNANLQKVALERDRLAEQVNAYISAVTPSGSNTVATIKNTGTSTVVVDHCLVLYPSGMSTPTAIKTAVGGSSSSGILPGSNMNITFSGNVSPENIKCVTSKGTVLPVKIDGTDGNYSVTDDIAIYSVVADVVPGTNTFLNNLAVKLSGMPTVTYDAPAGTMTYKIPVVSTITVTQVLAYTSSTAYTDISSGLTGTKLAGTTFTVPISTPTLTKLVIKYTGSDGKAHDATIWPQNVNRFSGSATVSHVPGITVQHYAQNGGSTPYNYVYVYGSDKVLGSTISCSFSYPECTNPQTYMSWGYQYNWNQGWVTFTPNQADGPVFYSNYWYSTVMPASAHVFKFPAPSSSFEVTLTVARSVSYSGYSRYSYVYCFSNSDYTNVAVKGTPAGGGSQATLYTASGLLSNTPSYSFVSQSGGAYYSYTGSTSMPASTYKFRVDNVQPGSQVQVNVEHVVSMQNQYGCYQWNTSYGLFPQSIMSNLNTSTSLSLAP